jgi:hypothetical protein
VLVGHRALNFKGVEVSFPRSASTRLRREHRRLVFKRRGDGDERIF